MLFLIVSTLALPTAAPQPAAVASASQLGGTAIPGLCMLARPAVLANAKVGVAATTRLQQLAQAAQAEVKSQRAAIDADSETLATQQGKVAPAVYQQRQKGIADRVHALQALAALRGREIEATREKALARIGTEMQPVVAQAYRARGCGLLIDRNTVVGGNMSNDLTAAVVQGLDGRISTITFDLETLP
jgi:Skp family chaperone for outer membrane proteins